MKIMSPMKEMNWIAHRSHAAFSKVWPSYLFQDYQAFFLTLQKYQSLLSSFLDKLWQKNLIIFEIF